MKYLVVVDMQNDFTFGTLRNGEAILAIPAIEAKIKKFDGEIVFTRDTHFPGYIHTQEGSRLPICHCLKDSEGWQIVRELEEWRLAKGCKVYDKYGFGSLEMAEDFRKLAEEGKVEEVEVVGVCTDVCVISNAILLKSAMPEVRIVVDSMCCAGVTRKSHLNALEAMKAVQIDVI